MNIEHRDRPSAEFRFFVYDALNSEFSYYRTAEDRDKGAEAVIQLYLDDAWDETVEQVVAGEMTHFCGQVGRQDRPAEAELDAERCDSDGKHWGDWEYTCNYDLLPLAAQGDKPIPDVILPTAAVEGDELVIRITLDTLCHAVAMADNWPTDCEGQSLATITDRPLFVKELIGELMNENEQGATPLHLLFDEAALAVIDAGTEAVDLREEEDDQ